MLGLRDEFTYFECSKCGCLQIAEIPENVERYYPSDYMGPLRHRPAENFVERFLGIRRDKYVLFNRGFVGRLVNRVHSRIYLGNVLQAIAKAGVNYQSRILDVGCGSGETLYLLRDLGLRNLVGVDPYISHEVAHRDVKILKQTIHDLPDSEKFDFVFFNHSFEHIPDQFETLSKVSEMLAENGTCLIRMPLKTERIWNLYGTNWVQIDAPRHFLIHTVRSFEHLVSEAGLVIEDVVFDSSVFQFWGSEQYKRDIPLQAENSYGVNPEKSIFTVEQIEEFREMASELNRTGQGDQASFYLVKNGK